MPGTELSEGLRLFLYQHVDSVELIEVLLYLRSQDLWMSPEQVSRELRSNPISIHSRLQALQKIGVADQRPDGGIYRYAPKSEELSRLVDELAEEYKVRRHTVLEMIFSSSKQVRDFANAFVLGKDSGKKGDKNG